MDALTSKTDTHFNHNSIELNNPINNLPQDILLLIFSFLSFQDLQNYSCVNSLCNRAKKLDILYQPKAQQDVIDDFIPLVNQSLVTWKEVRLYARLSKFFVQCMQKNRCVDAFNKHENPKCDCFSNATFYITKPFVKYGDYHFSIFESKNIKINQKGKDEPTFFIRKRGKNLFYLMVEKNYLFAVRQDGVIIQWDYIKKEKINKIQTIFSKQKILSRKPKVINKLCSINSFYIKNGLIVVTYKEKDWSNSVTMDCEIIDYINPERTVSIKCRESLRPLRILIEKNEIFIAGKDLIYTLNLSTHNFKTLISSEDDDIKDFTLNNDILYINVNFRKLYIFNIKDDKTKLFSLPLNNLKISEIEVLGNLLFGFSVETKQIVAINLNTNTMIETIPCDFNFTNTKIDTLNELIKLTRKNLDLIHLPQILKQEKRDNTARNCTIS